MIEYIKIKNFLLIKEQTIHFTENLNAIFGETGSGKSLIFKALGQIMGEKSNLKLIFKDCEYYLIEAHFKLTPQVKLELDKLQIDYDDNLIISRKVGTKSVSRVNGEVVNLTTLKSLSSVIFDVTKQNDTSTLSDSNFILNYLNITTDDLYKTDYSKYKDLKHEDLNLSLLQDSKLERQEIIMLRLKNLDKISELNSYEEYLKLVEEVENLKQIKLNQKIIKSVLDDCNNLTTIYERLCSNISQLNNEDIDNKINSSFIEFQNIDYLINQKYQISNIDFSDKLNLISDVKQLSRLYKIDESKIFNYYQELKSEYDALESVDIDIKLNQTKIEKIELKLRVHANEISNLRKIKSEQLRLDILKILKDLEMSHVDVKFNFNKLNLSINGIDQIDFLISTNNSNKFDSLSKVASGGEMSRILLAIKSLVSNDSVLLFDEIDSGLSGKVASLLSDVLVKLANKNQVIFISHLAQVISKSDNFIYVSKNINDECIQSTIENLESNEVVDKLSELINPVSESKEAKIIAQDMLK